MSRYSKHAFKWGFIVKVHLLTAASPWGLLLLLFVFLSEDLFALLLVTVYESEGATWQVHLSSAFTACFLSFLSVRKTKWNQITFSPYPFPHLCLFLSIPSLCLFPSFWRLDNLCIHEPELKLRGQKPGSDQEHLTFRCTVCGLLGNPEVKARTGCLVTPESYSMTLLKEAEVMKVWRKFGGLKLNSWWQFQVTQTALKKVGRKGRTRELWATKSESVMPKPWTLVQTCSEFDGYYYYYCFIFAFDLWCQNSAGQLCVVPLDMTLHKFCSKYLQHKKDKHSMWFYLTLIFFFFYYNESE